MIVSAVELLTGWWSDPATGINAQLPNVPRTAPQAAPGAVTIYNQNDHTWVERDEIPRALHIDDQGNLRRLFIVRLHPDPRGFVAQFLPEYDAEEHTIIPLVAIYVARKIESKTAGYSVADQGRDARQSIRTAMRVIAQHFDNAHSSYPLNGCTFSLPEPKRGGAILNADFIEPSADTVLDTLVVPLRVQDTWALGIT